MKLKNAKLLRIAESKADSISYYPELETKEINFTSSIMGLHIEFTAGRSGGATRFYLKVPSEGLVSLQKLVTKGIRLNEDFLEDQIEEHEKTIEELKAKVEEYRAIIED